jgi:hypothetical protein
MAFQFFRAFPPVISARIRADTVERPREKTRNSANELLKMKIDSCNQWLAKQPPSLRQTRDGWVSARMTKGTD